MTGDYPQWYVNLVAAAVDLPPEYARVLLATDNLDTLYAPDPVEFTDPFADYRTPELRRLPFRSP